MKKLPKYISCCGLGMAMGTGLILSACSDNSSYGNEVGELNDYVKHHNDSFDYYLTLKWDQLDSSFAAKKAAVAKDTVSMSKVQRDSFYLAVNKWNDYQTEYAKATSTAADKDNVAAMDDIRNSLHIDGVRADYADLNADRIVEQYQHFVDVVKANKDNYSKEQWIVVNTNWKELNGRKREINKDIVAKDEDKIIKLRLEYTGIKVINRPSILNEDPS